MFLIFTKTNCISCEKLIDFLNRNGQMFKEVNVSKNSISLEHMKTINSLQNFNIRKLIRNHSIFFRERGIDLESLSENELEKLVMFNLKDIGSFPVIINLSFSGRAKNCMIGYDEQVLNKWINDDSINNIFLDYNKIFCSDECCWLDKKNKIIQGFKQKKEDDVEKKKAVSLDNLYNLKNLNDSLVEKQPKEEKEEVNLEEINFNENLSKYNQAREKIIENDNRMKNSYDFFSMNNKNESFIEQLRKEKNEIINNSKSTSFDNSEKIIEEISDNKHEENIIDGLKDYDEIIEVFSDDFQNEINAEESDDYDEIIEVVNDVEIIEDEDDSNLENEVVEEMDEINDNLEIKEDQNGNINKSIEFQDDFIDVIVEDDNKKTETSKNSGFDYEISSEEKVVEEKDVNEYFDDFVKDEINTITEEKLTEHKDLEEKKEKPLKEENNLTNDEFVEINLSNNEETNNQPQEEQQQIVKQESVQEDDSDDFIEVDLSKDDFINIKDIILNNESIDGGSSDEPKISNSLHTRESSKLYINREEDEWIEKYRLSSNDIDIQRELENEK